MSRLQNRHSLPLGSFGGKCAGRCRGCKTGTDCRWVRSVEIASGTLEPAKPVQIAVGFVRQKLLDRFSRPQRRHSLPLGSFGRNCWIAFRGCQTRTTCGWVRFAEIARSRFEPAERVQIAVGFVRQKSRDVFASVQYRHQLPLGSFRGNCAIALRPRTIGTDCRWVRFAEFRIRLSPVIRNGFRTSRLRVVLSRNLSWRASTAQDPTSDYDTQNGRERCINLLGFLRQVMPVGSTADFGSNIWRHGRGANRAASGPIVSRLRDCVQTAGSE
jgi:hypothetical protein